jgi:hypothetical protein
LSSEEKLSGKFQGSLSGDAYGNLRIQGEKHSYPEVTIKNINGWSHQGNNACLFIGGFEHGISETPIENPENIYVTVELTPNGILRKWGTRELHYDGSIKSTHGYPEEIEWNLDIGKGKAFTLSV